MKNEIPTRITAAPAATTTAPPPERLLEPDVPVELVAPIVGVGLAVDVAGAMGTPGLSGPLAVGGRAGAVELLVGTGLLGDAELLPGVEPLPREGLLVVAASADVGPSPASSNAAVSAPIR